MDKLEQAIDLLLKWYDKNKRDLPWRHDKNPYHVWLSEIMLQQTRVEAVKGYYARFLQKIPDIHTLSLVDDEQLMKLWEGLGYYNRARNLKKAAITIEEEYHGVFPNTYEEIRSLSGIGDYTAGAIGSICFELQTPAVDGNVLRVYSRLFEDASNIDKTQTKKAVCSVLKNVYHSGHCGKTTQALMELGATVCIPNGLPHCHECPWKNICQTHQHKTYSNYPVREEKKKRKVVKKTIFILHCDDKYAIHKRPAKGLLSGLWEYPNVDIELNDQEAASYVSDLGVSPEKICMKTTYTHIFSHVEWQMTAYYFTCHNTIEKTPSKETYVWCSKTELMSQYALPSAFKPFFEIEL